MQQPFVRQHHTQLIASAFLVLFVAATIIYGSYLSQQGIAVRQWHWTNLLLVLPIVPLLFLQKPAGLPEISCVTKAKCAWWQTVGVGVVFGLLDVLVIKCIMHPQPYTELPPFLQPFPYSLFLYGAGALEVELFYRMLPLTLFLLLEGWLGKGRWRKVVIAVLAVVTSLIEPLQQWPDGAVWFVVYATASGVAMNAWQFRSYLQYGAGGSLAVRLGHYLIWHILLGVYVQFVELG